MTFIFKVFTASIIKKYFPKRTKMKLPEIPGSIIAQIAIAPQIKMNHHSAEVSAGVAMVI